MSKSKSTTGITGTRDWSLCFICQLEKSNEKTLNPSSSIKLRNNPEKLYACYKEVTDNIQELKELGELPDFIVVHDYSGGGVSGSSMGDGGGGAQNVVQLMMSNSVVWHKSCRNATDNQKVERARKKHEESISPVKTRRLSSGAKSTTQASSMPSTSFCAPVNTSCIFCGEVGNKKELRRAATLGLDRKVKECAQVVGDRSLLAKLAAGDMVAIDAVYHRACLTRLYRKAETVGCDTNENNETQVIRAYVLNELLDFIENYRGSGETLAMADLTALYDKRTVGLGFPSIKCNTTRLREDIERLIPDIKSVRVNRGWSFVFDDDLSKAVIDIKGNRSTDVSIILRAAKILRQEFLPMKQAFTGSFSTSSEADSIPPMLRSFLHMLLDGSGIDQPPPGPEKSQVAASIGQQIIFNSVRCRSKKPGSVPRHIKDRETPASLYLAMKLHLQTGSASLVQTMHQRGLCVSYDRLKTFSTDIANSVINHWEQIGVVVPPQAVKGVFTTGGFDNVDHNPSSTTATSALHGTCISIQQHFSSDYQQSKNLIDILDQVQMGKKHVKSLPSHYTTMDLDVSLPNDETLYVPSLNTNSHPYPASRPLTNIIEEGYKWLERVRNLLGKENLEAGEWISWAAYHASNTEPVSSPPAESYMLPLFTESPTSPTMAWHAMKVLCEAINYLNPGQTPVIVADQPLFTLAKKLQWKFPQTELGEDSFLVTLGPMHTEKMLWSVSGDWLNGSGWTTALTNSGISTSGKAQSFIGVHHICRTRYIHQVSVAALYILMKKAYDQFIEKVTNDDSELNYLISKPFDEWLKELCASQPQAEFWLKSMELDLLILQVRNVIQVICLFLALFQFIFFI